MNQNLAGISKVNRVLNLILLEFLHITTTNRLGDIHTNQSKITECFLLNCMVNFSLHVKSVVCIHFFGNRIQRSKSYPSRCLDSIPGRREMKAFLICKQNYL